MMSNTDNIVTDLKHAQQQILAYMQAHWRLFLFEGIFLFSWAFVPLLSPSFFPCSSPFSWAGLLSLAALPN